MEVKRQVVLIDPRKVLDRDLYPEEIARVEFVSDLHPEVAIVYFDERGIYNAYCVNELLVILPEKVIFENLCKNFGKLKRAELTRIFNLVTQYQNRNYINAFRIALSNQEISKLCMTDLGNFLSKGGK